MRQGTSKKILIIFLVVLITTLVGVSIFIASRVLQTQAPASSSADASCIWTTSDNCGAGCKDYFDSRPGCCGGSTGRSCTPGNNGGNVTCESTVTYGGTSIRVAGECSGRGVFQSTTSYDGGASKCPTTEGYHQIDTIGSNGGAYTAAAPPGTCTQIDIQGVGGVCNCEPPTVQVIPKYSCSNSSCIRDDTNGTYTDSNCLNQCSPTIAQCNEACSTSSTCATGLSCISNVCRLATNPSSTTCQPVTQTTAQCNEACSDSVTCTSGLSCTSGVCRLATNPTSTTCQPPTQIAAQCISLDENGSDPLASGAGNFVIYTLTYQNPAATNPYPNIRLRVGTSGSPVGRDANHTSSTSVQAFNVTHDTVANTYKYQFKWEAATTAGSNVPAGTYNVRVLLDGSTEVTSPASCTESITLSQTAVEEPLFTTLKQSNASCGTGGDGVINYTVTITNIGSVPGTIDFVQDTYDSQVYSLGILPTSVNPSYGVINTGKITWTGDNSQRTYTAGQAKTFTYTVRIPKANMTTFATTGLLNQAVVQYDTSTTNNNTASFDLRTPLNCTIIPNTGIIDDYKFILVGLLFIVLGLIVFRFRIGNQISLLLLDRTSRVLNKQTEGIARKIMPYEESIMDEMEKKREKDL